MERIEPGYPAPHIPPIVKSGVGGARAISRAHDKSAQYYEKIHPAVTAGCKQPVTVHREMVKENHDGKYASFRMVEQIIRHYLYWS